MSFIILFAIVSFNYPKIMNFHDFFKISIQCFDCNCNSYLCRYSLSIAIKSIASLPAFDFAGEVGA